MKRVREEANIGKEEPFIECHPPLQELSLLSYDHSLAYCMIYKNEKQKRRKRTTKLNYPKLQHEEENYPMLEPDKFKMLKSLQLQDFDDGRTLLLHDDCSTSDEEY